MSTEPTSTDLNDSALRVLRTWGVTVEELARAGWVDGCWHGDVCGCQDSRCIGFHHDAWERCWCLPEQVQGHLQRTGQVTAWQCMGDRAACAVVHPVADGYDWHELTEVLNEHAREVQHPTKQAVTFRLTHTGGRPFGLWNSAAHWRMKGSAQRPTS